MNKSIIISAAAAVTLAACTVVVTPDDSVKSEPVSFTAYMEDGSATTDYDPEE